LFVSVNEYLIPIQDGQDTIDYIAEYLEVKVKIVENRELSRSRLEVTFRNTGLSIINGIGWNVYFNQLQTLENSADTASQDSAFLVSNVKGTLMR